MFRLLNSKFDLLLFSFIIVHDIEIRRCGVIANDTTLHQTPKDKGVKK